MDFGEKSGKEAEGAESVEARELLDYCLNKTGAVEEYPFGPDVTVIKVAAKMFALYSHRNGNSNLSLKCDPELAEILRQQYREITPGYHLNKQHWNTIVVNGSIPAQEVYEMIDHSYHLVVKSLPRDVKASLGIRT